MASHMSTIAAETSGANATAGNNPHHAIQVDSVEHWNQQFVRELLDRNWKNEELLKLLDDYFDDTHKTINFYAAVVQEYLQSANNYQSVNWEVPLMNISHHDHFFHDLVGVYRQQLLLCHSLKSFQNDLTQKLDRAKAWKKVSAVALTAAVVIASAAAAATARKPATAAAAAAATILLGAIGSWAISLLKKYKDGVKKHVEITRVMAVGAKITMNSLISLHLSACQFAFLTKLVSEMAESADVDAGEVRKKLMESFQDLQRKAVDFCRDICLARAFTLQSVIKHLDFITS